MSVINKLFKKPLEQLEFKFLSAKEHLKEEVGETLSKVIIYGTIGVLSLFAVLFLSLGLALFLNYLLESSAAGFVIVGAFYICGSGALFLLRKRNFVYRRSERYARLLMRREVREAREEYEKMRLNGHTHRHVTGHEVAVDAKM